MVEDGLQLFGGDWTGRKLDALDRYLRAYTTALSRRRFTLYYIDAFAGTGYRQQRIQPLPSVFAEQLGEDQSQQFLDGSARIALRVQPPFDQHVLIELDAVRAAELERLKLEFPARADSIRIVRSDCNQVIQDLCRAWDPRNARGVLFLDPFGMQVEWRTVQAVARTGCIDVWILFPLACNRLLMRDPNRIPAAWCSRLDRTFGTPEWRTRFYRQEALPDLFADDEIVIEKALTMESLGAYYDERLRSVFPVVAGPAVLRNTRNAPLFQLFFAAGNRGRGGEIALRIARHILDRI